MQIPCGLVARIAGSHPAGPGSIPGTGNFLAFPDQGNHDVMQVNLCDFALYEKNSMWNLDTLQCTYSFAIRYSQLNKIVVDLGQLHSSASSTLMSYLLQPARSVITKYSQSTVLKCICS